MSTKVRTVLALLMVIMGPAGCGGANVEAESIEDAAEQFVLSVSGNVTLVPSAVRLVHEMERQSATDRVGEVAVFALCQAVG
jgi:hypothetical protein